VLDRILTGLARLYLLRVPVLVGLVMLWMGSALTPGAGGETILRGIFDVAGKDSSNPITILFFTLTTMAAVFAGIAVGVTSYSILSNASDRFGVTPLTFSPGVELLFRILPAIPVATVVGAALCHSHASLAGRITGLVAGVAISWSVSLAPRRHLSKALRLIPFIDDAGFVIGNKAGFVNTAHKLQAKHVFAIAHLLLAFGAYLGYFGLSFLHSSGKPLLAPTLAVVLVLLTMICWGFSGLTFLLDYYRVPVILLVVAWSFVAGTFRQGDHFYQGFPGPQSLSCGVKGSDIIGREKQKPVILVSATGGGIQAAAWTAQVLGGLSNEIKGGAIDFRDHVRLISSVSGGSVGAMYFVDSYSGPAVSAEALVDRAADSSLEPVAWGLTYPDLVFGMFPMLKGFRPDPLVDSDLIFYDRGRLLEDSWRIRLTGGNSDVKLSEWRTDVARRQRPAVIFNSTFVETGQRFLLSTTEFDEDSDVSAGNERTRFTGRQDFFSLYPHSDLRLRTAVRLSATFPYVSPATRFLRNDVKPAEGGLYAGQSHAVDGGYYDNYGLTTLLDWLDLSLKQIQEVDRPKILIIEIRSSPTENKTSQSDAHGFLFQLLHPLQTLYDVRGAGQISHNAIDKDLVQRLYGQKIKSVVFEFKDTDKTGCSREEPTSWHLTDEDKQAIQRAWHDNAQTKENVEKVRKFLRDNEQL
jgi:hypothetical protein